MTKPFAQEPDQPLPTTTTPGTPQIAHSAIPQQAMMRRRRSRNAIPRAVADPAGAPVVMAVGDEAARFLAHRGHCWDDLDAVEQTILMVAAREHTLDQACAAWSDHPDRPADMRLTKTTAVAQFHRGLIGFYRVDDGYPDLSSNDLATVLAGHSYWDARHGNSRLVGMYLTTAGEDTVLGP